MKKTDRQNFLIGKKINNVESAYLNIENFIFAKKYLFYQIPVLDLQVTQS